MKTVALVNSLCILQFSSSYTHKEPTGWSSNVKGMAVWFQAKRYLKILVFSSFKMTDRVGSNLTK